MPRNDRSDALSVRGDDDPRKPVKALEQEAEIELGRSQATDSGGVEHQGPAEHEPTRRNAAPTGSRRRE
jgi:hypothetical protein